MNSTFKWKVDGLHTDLKKTSTKIVLDKSGTSLAEIISSGTYNYHIMLPEEAIHIPQNNLDKYYQDNYNYLAIYKSTLALGEKSWCLSAYNAIEYYNWFSRSVIRNLNFTPQELEHWIVLFCKEKMLAPFN